MDDQQSPQPSPDMNVAISITAYEHSSMKECKLVDLMLCRICHLLGSQQTATVTAGMAYWKQNPDPKCCKLAMAMNWLRTGS